MQIEEHYKNVKVDKFCVMPDHIHLLLLLDGAADGVDATSVSNVVGSLKRWVSKQTGQSFWQRSFYDHVIRNEEDYKETWKYIDNNPLKYLYEK